LGNSPLKGCKLSKKKLRNQLHLSKSLTALQITPIKNQDACEFFNELHKVKLVKFNPMTAA
jgi:hypothetical protein